MLFWDFSVSPLPNPANLMGRIAWFGLLAISPSFLSAAASLLPSPNGLGSPITLSGQSHCLISHSYLTSPISNCHWVHSSKVDLSLTSARYWFPFLGTALSHVCVWVLLLCKHSVHRMAQGKVSSFSLLALWCSLLPWYTDIMMDLRWVYPVQN